MCGIAGFVNAVSSDFESSSILEGMLNAIKHRGPDDYGIWENEDKTLYLGHRRLSILDLTSTGHQPMISFEGRYAITFNGEIYNHQKIRAELSSSNISWRGTSDTETLLNAIEVWGLDTTLKKCVGMFAFAIWDKKSRELILCRDRLGEKPLYYGWQDGVFLFSSELKACKQHPSFKSRIDREALGCYLRYGYVPIPLSIYKGIYKLLPGSYIKLKLSALKIGELPEAIKYWNVVGLEVGEGEQAGRISNQEYINQLQSLLTESVSLQMISDVPLGAFLSGGIDSSLITSIMQAHSSSPIKTFTIGFEESLYNEAVDAKSIAQHLGTDHTEMYVSSSDALNLIPSLSQVYDEPFADSSSIPTLLLARLTRQSVKVSLSGDGGDELFYGYRRYQAEAKLWRNLESIPSSLKPLFDTIFGYLGKSKGSSLVSAKVLKKISTLSGLLGYSDFNSFYSERTSHWKSGDCLLGAEGLPYNFPDACSIQNQKLAIEELMMLCDLKRYLPDDILVKVDRACMSCGLESRVPMLDHRLVEFARRLPFGLKFAEGENKWILKKLLERYIPRELFDRPKKGFGIPMANWLRTPLRDWAEELLKKENLKDSGFSNIDEIESKWSLHKSGVLDYGHSLWVILTYLDWRRNNC